MNDPKESKINGIALLMALITLILIVLDVSDEITAQVLIISTLLGPALIGIARTWFTDKRGQDDAGT